MLDLISIQNTVSGLLSFKTEFLLKNHSKIQKVTRSKTIFKLRIIKMQYLLFKFGCDNLVSTPSSPNIVFSFLLKSKDDLLFQITFYFYKKPN